jgi:hypothetical protein
MVVPYRFPAESKSRLYTDDNGLPGSRIHSWHLSDVPPIYNTQQRLVVIKFPVGIAVTQGTQYWVVAEATGTAVDWWMYTYNVSLGGWAWNQGQGWTLKGPYAIAFGVFGQQTD